MASEELGRLRHVVAMDSLIHYEPADGIDVMAGLAGRVRRQHRLHLRAEHAGCWQIMHAVGQALPPRRPLAGHPAGLRAVAAPPDRGPSGLRG
jgi:hypothetical protein